MKRLEISSTNGKQKHEIVRDALAESVRSGEFALGRRLPADRDLAVRFGVSYMTARRAVTELVEASLLERRIGDGTYVRAGSQQRLQTTTLNLVCTAYEGSTTKSFLRLGGAAALERGWRSHVIRMHDDADSMAIRAIENGEFCLVLADEKSLEGPLGKALKKSRGRSVLIGWRLDAEGVPSVLADDTRAMNLALEHLQSAGHERVALLCNHSHSPNEQVQIAAWRRWFENGPRAFFDLETHFVEANTPPYQCATRFAFNATKSWLHGAQQNGATRATALISVSDELALGALAACREANLHVPRDLSLVNLNDSALMEFAHPPVSCVDVDLNAHIVAALELMDQQIHSQQNAPEQSAQNNGSNKLPLCLIEPHLIERSSVREPVILG